MLPDRTGDNSDLVVNDENAIKSFEILDRNAGVIPEGPVNSECLSRDFGGSAVSSIFGDSLEEAGDESEWAENP